MNINKNFIKCEKTTWNNMIETCKNNNINLAEVVIHSKYQINS